MVVRLTMFLLKGVEKSTVVAKGPFLLDNNITVNTNELIGFTGTAGVVNNAIAVIQSDKQLIGVVDSIVDAQGNPILGSQQKTITRITTPSNNTTAKIYYVIVIPVYPELMWEADVDADLGTTAGSDRPGYFSLANAGTVSESSFVLPNSGSAPKMLFSLGPAIDSSTGQPSRRKVLVHFKRSIWNF